MPISRSRMASGEFKLGALNMDKRNSLSSSYADIQPSSAVVEMLKAEV